MRAGQVNKNIFFPYLLCLAACFPLGVCFSQNYPADFFRLPVDTVPRLAGNFGEIRRDHFHYGWDLRTGNHEGMKIVAAGDGYVSRIKTGPYGYGKVLYITHPNGYVSVYGHLSSFSDAIAKLVKDEQYAKESYEVELFPAPSTLPVKKGELIALSGNTGNSSGPHLHFELRDAKTEEIINPYFFGLSIEDTVKPVIQLLALYPLGASGIINGSKEPLFVPLKGKKGEYQFKTNDSVVVSGKIGLGLQCYDNETGSPGFNQVYSLELQVDGKTIYSYEMTRFSFSDTRYVNCHIDYKEQRKYNRDVQRAFLLPNNRFPVYKNLVDSGIIEFHDEKIHYAKFIIKDFYGNASYLAFEIKSGPGQELKKKNISASPVFKHLKWDQPYNMVMENIRIEMPAGILYEDLDMLFSSRDTSGEFLTSLFSIHHSYTPLLDYFSLSLKCPPLPDSLLSKLLIVSLTEKGRIINEGGEYKEGWISTKTRSFGTYSVMIDTTPPKIKAPPLPKNKSISKLKNIEFKVSDNLSGIKNYRVELDGKWILFEYEPKKGILSRKNDEYISAGEHNLKVMVKDGRGNRSSMVFTYRK